jgi:hypothetical protein
MLDLARILVSFCSFCLQQTRPKFPNDFYAGQLRTPDQRDPFRASPLIQRETNELIELSNNVNIEITTASFRTTCKSYHQ